MHQETSPPKINSRRFFQVLETYRRTPGMHCSCQVQSFSDQFQSSVSFSSEPHVNLASNCSGALLPVPPSYPPRRTVAWTLAGVGGELAEVHRPVSGGSSTRCGCQRGAARDGAVQHRPHHQKPTRGRLLPCACCSTVAVA